jgi:AcrR family transcriptional regulator
VPRAGLSRARLAAEAAALADEVGWDRVTLAALAERVGVRLPSLYKHVESLDALRQEVATLATRELADALTVAAVGRAGHDALRSVADAYRAFGRAHPGRYQATVRAAAPDDPAHTAASEAALQVVLAVLRGYGITGEDAIDAARGLRAALHGFVTLEAAGGFGLPREVDRSYARWLDAWDRALRGWDTDCVTDDDLGGDGSIAAVDVVNRPAPQSDVSR